MCASACLSVTTLAAPCAYLVKIAVTIVNFTLQMQYEIGTKLQKWHWTTYLVGLHYMCMLDANYHKSGNFRCKNVFVVDGGYEN